MILLTSSYWTSPPGFVLVRTSQGTPTGMEHLPVLTAAIPSWKVRALASGTPTTEACLDAEQTWQDAYWDLLCERADRLITELDRLVGSVHQVNSGLALACFERNPNDCHRSVLADWLRSHDVQVSVTA